VSSGLITAIVAIVGLAITVAAVFGSFRVARNTQTTSLYRETALAWEAKARAQEAEIHELQERDTEKDKRIATLQARVEVLQDTVTGRAALESLQTMVAHTHAQLEDLGQVLAAVREDVRGLRAQAA
jgi:uncharacterized protein YlxW (UPF0749 family)